MIRKLDHLVITTADIPACIAFYEALGFRAQDAGGRWELFAGDFKINVHHKGHELTPRAAHVQTGSADLCFETDRPLADCRTPWRATRSSARGMPRLTSAVRQFDRALQLWLKLPFARVSNSQQVPYDCFLKM